VRQYIDAVGDAACGGGDGAAAAVRALSQPPRLAQKQAREVPDGLVGAATTSTVRRLCAGGGQAAVATAERFLDLALATRSADGRRLLTSRTAAPATVVLLRECLHAGMYARRPAVEMHLSSPPRLRCANLNRTVNLNTERLR
jgi:hypothetical protein